MYADSYLILTKPNKVDGVSSNFLASETESSQNPVLWHSFQSVAKVGSGAQT